MTVTAAHAGRFDIHSPLIGLLVRLSGYILIRAYKKEHMQSNRMQSCNQFRGLLCAWQGCTTPTQCSWQITSHSACVQIPGRCHAFSHKQQHSPRCLLAFACLVTASSP